MAEDYVPYEGPIVKRSDAKAAGEKYYYSGKPCKAGHLTQRRIEGGTCPICRVGYTIDREKKRARQKKWTDANVEKERARKRKYSKENPEKFRAWAANPESRAKKNAATKARYEQAMATDPDKLRAKWREDYKRNRQAGIARTLRWQAANADHMKEYRVAHADEYKRRSKEWMAKNPDKVRAKSRQWQQDHPEQGRLWRKSNPAAVKAIKQNRRSLERAAEGNHTADEIKALFKRQKGRCVYCRVSIAKAYDVDHVQPLSRGGSNWISNLQLLCGSCNNRKWATDPLEYARRIGLLL